MGLRQCVTVVFGACMCCIPCRVGSRLFPSSCTCTRRRFVVPVCTWSQRWLYGGPVRVLLQSKVTLGKQRGGKAAAGKGAFRRGQASRSIRQGVQ